MQTIGSSIRRIAVLLVVSVILAACGGGGSSSGSADDDMVRAIGLWEIAKKSLSSDSHSEPFVVGGEIFVASLSNNLPPDGLDCTTVKDFVSGSITIRQLNGEQFDEVASLELRDTFANEVMSGDVTKDGNSEIILSAGCYGGMQLVGYTMLDGKWLPLDFGRAAMYKNGMIFGVNEDCKPSCANTGYEYTLFEWNGVSFVEGGLVTSEGMPVNLAVTGTCSNYRQADTLPLKMCDKGPLVEKFMVMARNIGDYGGVTVSNGGNQLTPDVMKWVMTYRYRKGLEIIPEVNGELFESLDTTFYPEDGSYEARLFDSYCVESSWPECLRREYLVPTDECPETRAAYEQEFPLRLCDYGEWVIMLESVLEGFDGKTATTEPPELHMFDAALVERVKAYQAARNLSITGEVDVPTWTSLFGPASAESSDDINEDGVYGPGDIIPH